MQDLLVPVIVLLLFISCLLYLIPDPPTQYLTILDPFSLWFMLER